MSSYKENGSKAYLYGICAVAVIGGLLFGYDTAVISGAEQALQEFFRSGLGDWYTNALHGTVVSSALIGCIIGGLILGEFAVEAEWFVPETIIYMALEAIASFAQPSFEMGYAMKFCRIFLLILSEIFAFWGFLGGCVAILLLTVFSKTFSGKSYLSPIIPFKPRDFARMFVRTSIRNRQH